MTRRGAPTLRGCTAEVFAAFAEARGLAVAVTVSRYQAHLLQFDFREAVPIASPTTFGRADRDIHGAFFRSSRLEDRISWVIECPMACGLESEVTVTINRRTRSRSLIRHVKLTRPVSEFATLRVRVRSISWRVVGTVGPHVLMSGSLRSVHRLRAQARS